MNASQSLQGDTPRNTGRRTFMFTAFSLASMALVAPVAITRAFEAADGALDDSAFMTVSRLVSSTPLNATTGRALYLALKQSDSNFDARLNALAQKIAEKSGITIDMLAADLDRDKQADLRDTLNKIVAAWYLGVVDFKTYAYDTALMFGVVSDVLSPPSYVRRGPLYWATSIDLPAN